MYTMKREWLPATAVSPKIMLWVVRGPDNVAVAQVERKADAWAIKSRLDAAPMMAHAA